MRFPPALNIDPQASPVFRGFIAMLVAGLFATFLIAIDAINTLGLRGFSVKNALWLLLMSAIGGWAMLAGWRKPQGSLHYAQGQWSYQDAAGQALPGTLALHCDLQGIILLSFHAQPASPFSFWKKSHPWFALERRHYPAPSWTALRCALYGPVHDANLPDQGSQHNLTQRQELPHEKLAS